MTIAAVAVALVAAFVFWRAPSEVAIAVQTGVSVPKDMRARTEASD